MYRLCLWKQSFQRVNNAILVLSFICSFCESASLKVNIPIYLGQCFGRPSTNNNCMCLTTEWKYEWKNHLQARYIACRSYVGFHEPSTITTRLAAWRLIPKDPALVEIKVHFTLLFEGSLNRSTNFCLSELSVLPSSLYRDHTKEPTSEIIFISREPFVSFKHIVYHSHI